LAAHQEVNAESSATRRNAAQVELAADLLKRPRIRRAEEYEIHFVDLQEVFDKYFKTRGENGQYAHHSTFIAWDRVHPNQIGATLIAAAFLSACGLKLSLTEE
ncbi:MAG: hypothetical protein J5589_03190, partial [Firmicutes bacterium]|nr:hypothetical protein [Bacillota bacterium]